LRVQILPQQEGENGGKSMAHGILKTGVWANQGILPEVERSAQKTS